VAKFHRIGHRESTDSSRARPILLLTPSSMHVLADDTRERDKDKREIPPDLPD